MINRSVLLFAFVVAVVSLPCHAQQRWPRDKDRYQVGTYPSDSVPQCRTAAPVLTADSLGPVRPLQRLAELERICPRLRYAWEWGHEGIPTPAVLLRLGEAVVEVEFPDTVPSSPAYRIRLDNPIVKTADGFGPGSELEAMARAWGAPRFGVGECVLYASFESRPGLSFRVRVPESWQCGDVNEVERGKAPQLPPGTTVREVLLFQ